MINPRVGVVFLERMGPSLAPAVDRRQQVGNFRFTSLLQKLERLAVFVVVKIPQHNECGLRGISTAEQDAVAQRRRFRRAPDRG
jgi:hypothetical protein